MSAQPDASPAATSPLRLALAWLIVGLPAAWGISQTAIQAAALFRAAPAVVKPTPATQSVDVVRPASTPHVLAVHR